MATMTNQSEVGKERHGTAQVLLSVRNVAKSFGKSPVLRDISLEIAQGEFLTILDESGSGKTTLPIFPVRRCSEDSCSCR